MSQVSQRPKRGTVGQIEKRIMREYTYQLRAGSQKDICPRCEKRTFTPYVDREGNKLSDDVGRCDRRDKCKYHYTPKEYFNDNRDNEESGKKDKGKTMERRVYEPPKYIEPSDFALTMKRYERNNLAVYLHKIFDNKIGVKEVERVLIEYAVGTSKEFGGSPIFWFIDHYGNIRDGKIMGYNPDTGKRIKEPRPQFNNVHTLMKEKYQGQFKPCFFGSHLTKIQKYNNLPIWIFESEKAALIVALTMVWGGVMLGLPVATSGCESLNPTAEHKRDPYDRVQLLKNRDIVLFPDNGKFDEWKLKGMALKDFSNSVYISTTMESNRHPHKIDCIIEEGDAIDDVILKYFEEGKDVGNLLLTSYGNKGQNKLV